MNPTDPGGDRFRVELVGGDVVEVDGSTVEAGAGEKLPAVVLRMRPARAHSLAHVLAGWSRVLGLAPDKAAAEVDAVVARALETGAATLGDPGALLCAARVSGGISTRQRLAAAEVLSERERRLSPLQRVAVVDAAARWMDEDAGDELAHALLAAVCSSDSATGHVYLALLAPAGPPV